MLPKYIFFLVNILAGLAWKIEDHCCQNELCPFDCERCDGVVSCYDLSDELGCSNQTDQDLLSYRKPPVFVPFIMNVVKAKLRKDKIANFDRLPDRNCFKPKTDNTRHDMGRIEYNATAAFQYQPYLTTAKPTTTTTMSVLDRLLIILKSELDSRSLETTTRQITTTTSTTEVPVWKLLLEKLRTQTAEKDSQTIHPKEISATAAVTTNAAPVYQVSPTQETFTIRPITRDLQTTLPETTTLMRASTGIPNISNVSDEDLPNDMVDRAMMLTTTDIMEVVTTSDFIDQTVATKPINENGNQTGFNDSLSISDEISFNYTGTYDSETITLDNTTVSTLNTPALSKNNTELKSDDFTDSNGTIRSSPTMSHVRLNRLDIAYVGTIKEQMETIHVMNVSSSGIQDNETFTDGVYPEEKLNFTAVNITELLTLLDRTASKNYDTKTDTSAITDHNVLESQNSPGKFLFPNMANVSESVSFMDANEFKNASEIGRNLNWNNISLTKTANSSENGDLTSKDFSSVHSNTVADISDFNVSTHNKRTGIRTLFPVHNGIDFDVINQSTGLENKIRANLTTNTLSISVNSTQTDGNASFEGIIISDVNKTYMNTTEHSDVNVITANTNEHQLSGNASRQALLKGVDFNNRSNMLEPKNIKHYSGRFLAGIVGINTGTKPTNMPSNDNLKPTVSEFNRNQGSSYKVKAIHPPTETPYTFEHMLGLFTTDRRPSAWWDPIPTTMSYYWGSDKNYVQQTTTPASESDLLERLRALYNLEKTANDQKVLTSTQTGAQENSIFTVTPQQNVLATKTLNYDKVSTSTNDNIVLTNNNRDSSEARMIPRTDDNSAVNDTHVLVLEPKLESDINPFLNETSQDITSSLLETTSKILQSLSTGTTSPVPYTTTSFGPSPSPTFDQFRRFNLTNQKDLAAWWKSLFPTTETPVATSQRPVTTTMRPTPTTLKSMSMTQIPTTTHSRSTDAPITTTTTQIPTTTHIRTTDATITTATTQIPTTAHSQMTDATVTTTTTTTQIPTTTTFVVPSTKPTSTASIPQLLQPTGFTLSSDQISIWWRIVNNQLPVRTTTPPPPTTLIPTTPQTGGVDGCTKITDFAGICLTQSGRFRNPSNCKSFYVCDWGTLHACLCPQGTLFDERIGVCNWDTLVLC